MAKRNGTGDLIIIGGGEDKEKDRAILKEVVRRATRDKGRLVVVTAATQIPEEYLEDYLPLFEELGVRHVDVVDIRSREDAYRDDVVDQLRRAAVIFFTGGSQLRIASLVGGTPAYEAMQQARREGATVAGTSAGAAVMPETMLVAGPSDSSLEAADVDMAPGLGLMSDVVIDSHFAERGRIGRLVAAVAQNPRNLGIGIDEDTAIVVGGQQNFSVIGSGAVYVVDGTGISYSSLERRTRGILSVHDVKLHVLGHDDCFDWADRHPRRPDE